MADPAFADAPVATSDEPGTRGRLVIKDRAIAKIAATAALNVPGVVPQGGGLTRITGRDLPRADVSTGAQSVAVNLYLGVQWPCDITELTQRVHTEVGRQLEDLTGMPLHQLGVLVAGTEYDGSAESVDPLEPMPAATVTPPLPPTAAPAAVPAAVVIAIGLLALAVVAARELLIARGAFAAAPWLQNTFEWLGRLHWQQWLIPVALSCLVVGVLFILLALAPRTRTHVAVRIGGAAATVWMRPTDIARMCSARASTVAGVVSAHTTVDRRRVTVRVTADPATTDPTPGAVDESVRAVVESALAILDRPLPLRVKVRTTRVRASS
ncbi:DUF6286 domain-containing Asp23/Gls24 family envelope stress response protein [Rhodococcus sp. ABRD24]|uniref:DUF6286 domain-containing Asp23/Gls24 family envelope stress response protein n=1 Tax=Rhodococcus sp. ABRD24 TaxID=2507582 RepID=UPI001F621C30|nr:DUF6286 domain-containing Asp23/Gls24 family envelope stress response protein [Rhodococcus sp. ABRD24]